MQVRGEDIACRSGGDEFVLVLTDASREVTGERAERFHLQIDGQNLAAVTLSPGVAISPEHGVTSTGILRAVDAALYRAKHEGRGRVIMAE